MLSLLPLLVLLVIVLSLVILLEKLVFIFSGGSLESITLILIGIVATVAPAKFDWFWLLALFPKPKLAKLFKLIVVILFILLWELLAFLFLKADNILSVFNSPIADLCNPISWHMIPIYPVFGALLKLELFITLLKSFEALLIWDKDLYAWSNSLFPIILWSLCVIYCSLSIKSANLIKLHNIFWLTITYFLKQRLIAVKTFWVVFNRGKGIFGSTSCDIILSASSNSVFIFFKCISYFLSVLDVIMGNWDEYKFLLLSTFWGSCAFVLLLFWLRFNGGGFCDEPDERWIGFNGELFKFKDSPIFKVW